MAVLSVTIFKDINDKFIKGTITVDLSDQAESYLVEGVPPNPINLTDNVVFSYVYTPEPGFIRKGTSTPYITVPAGVSSFDFGFFYDGVILTANVADFTVGGITASIVLDEETTLTDPTLPSTTAPPGQAPIYTAERTTVIPGASGDGVETPGGGSVTTTDIEIDYSNHLDRLVTALDQISSNINQMRAIQEQTVLILSQLNNNYQQSAVAATRVADTISGDAIPTKDIYAALGYASLIRLFEEQGVDINSLLQKTKNILEGLE